MGGLRNSSCYDSPMAGQTGAVRGWRGDAREDVLALGRAFSRGRPASRPALSWQFRKKEGVTA